MGARAHVEQNVKMWNEHDTDGWVGDFAPTAQVSAPGASGTGTEMARAFYAIWQDAFPDARIRDERIFEDGDTGTLQAVFAGTHTATMNAPDQSIPATGRTVSLPFVVVSRYEGGKVVEFALYFDRAELMGQLGLLPDAG